MTLNTFHSAGQAIATVITGVPRFGELLNATKDPSENDPSITPLPPNQRFKPKQIEATIWVRGR